MRCLALSPPHLRTSHSPHHHTSLRAALPPHRATGHAHLLLAFYTGFTRQKGGPFYTLQTKPCVVLVGSRQRAPNSLPGRTDLNHIVLPGDLCLDGVIALPPTYHYQAWASPWQHWRDTHIYSRPPDLAADPLLRCVGIICNAARLPSPAFHCARLLRSVLPRRRFTVLPQRWFTYLNTAPTRSGARGAHIYRFDMTAATPYRRRYALYYNAPHLMPHTRCWACRALSLRMTAPTR